MLTYIFISLLTIAFFSGMEIAFISSNKIRFELEKRNKRFSSYILSFFYRNPYEFISLMLVGYYLSLIVYVLLVVSYIESSIGLIVDNQILFIFIQSFFATILILIAGEFLPKTIFKTNPNLYLKIFSIPLAVFYVVLYPVTKIITLITFLILTVFGIKDWKRTVSKSLGKVDLDFFIQQSLENLQQKAEIENEVKIFQNALDFSNVRLRDCMVPRTEIVACDKQTSIQELKNKFIETGYSKILVFNDSIDGIVGYIHSSELFTDIQDWTTRIISVPIVPENMTANTLMKMLLQEKRSIAVVVDEFGGTAGIVTLEDLVEEIFGEIEDEHDMKSLISKQLSEKEYLVSGRLEVDLLNEKFDLDLPESDDYQTIAGYILHNYQKFPKVNEIIDIGRYSMKIVKVTSTKIELVRIKVID